MLCRAKIGFLYEMLREIQVTPHVQDVLQQGNAVKLKLTAQIALGDLADLLKIAEEVPKPLPKEMIRPKYM